MSLAAPFPYFGGKRRAARAIWREFGDPAGYVEPFAGSAAVLLARPNFEGRRVETINDSDGWLVNTWRAIRLAPAEVAAHAAGPVSEIDYHARLAWLQERRTPELVSWLEGDPEVHDAKAAGWWLYVAACGIGDPWDPGPWRVIDGHLTDTRELPHLGDAGRGVNRELPHLGNAGQGVNRKLPHLGNAGRGINRQSDTPRREFIMQWFADLHARLRNVRVCCGDWGRVVKDSVTTRHGLTGVFLDPPYTKGAMQYAAGGVGTSLPLEVQAWAQANGHNPQLRIMLCGHAGEHDALLAHGWHTRTWTASKGYALTDEATQNTQDETLWCSPHCVPQVGAMADLFAEHA